VELQKVGSTLCDAAPVHQVGAETRHLGTDSVLKATL
jgi:hypothetical protein